MEEKQKKKLNNWLIGIGLAILILFVVITSIVINYQQKKYDEIKNDNDEIEGQLPEEKELCILNNDFWNN